MNGSSSVERMKMKNTDQSIAVMILKPWDHGGDLISDKSHPLEMEASLTLAVPLPHQHLPTPFFNFFIIVIFPPNLPILTMILATPRHILHSINSQTNTPFSIFWIWVESKSYHNKRISIFPFPNNSLSTKESDSLLSQIPFYTTHLCCQRDFTLFGFFI